MASDTRGTSKHKEKKKKTKKEKTAPLGPFHHYGKSVCVCAFFFFFFFFFTQVQTPVTLCSGELRSVLVVRLAHSADLRSRLRHVYSAPSVAYSTGCSRVVTHPGTNQARRCLTSVI